MSKILASIFAYCQKHSFSSLPKNGTYKRINSCQEATLKKRGQAGFPCLRGKQTSRSFWEEILNYHWPGNIREVIHILKRAGIEQQEPITGEDIRKLTDYFRENETEDELLGKDIVEKIFNDFKSGKNFWEVVKKPFLNRDFNREQVKSVISKALSEVGGKYKSLLKLFGIKEEEYINLMRFLYDNDLKS